MSWATSSEFHHRISFLLGFIVWIANNKKASMITSETPSHDLKRFFVLKKECISEKQSWKV